MTVVKVYHFKLPGFCHLVTAVYPTGTRDGVMIDDNELGKCFTQARLVVVSCLKGFCNKLLLHVHKNIMLMTEATWFTYEPGLVSS